MSYALITGASTGIGYEFAKVFAKNRVSLVIVARNLEKLNSLANELEEQYKIKVHAIDLDLSEVENVYILYEKINELGIDIKYLINNAGFGLNGEFLELNLSKQQEMINLNITSLTTLAWLFGKKMKKNANSNNNKQKNGYILNVASVAGFFPGPYMNVYYATKAYVVSFSIGLAEELSKYNIVVNALCPGPTASNFADNAGMGNSLLFKVMPLPSSEEVAIYGYNQLINGKKISIHGIMNKLNVFISKFSSKILMSKIVGKLQQNRQF